METKKKEWKRGGPWTPERKAELRAKMPKKMNKYGEWLFSDEGAKDYLIIVDEEAVLQ